MNMPLGNTQEPNGTCATPPGGGRLWADGQPSAPTRPNKRDVNVKIAIVTDDGQTVSQHFGRAPLYAVITVEDGSIVGREIRAKVAPHSASDDHAERAPEDHTGPAALDKHTQMIGPIGDCACLIAGGMGRGAWTHLRDAGLRPVVTTISDIDEAALACASGRIVEHLEMLH